MRFTVRLHDALDAEFARLPEAVQDELLALMALLGEYGPNLGRPHADTLRGSKHANMKELRFRAANGVWRATFAFDRKREAILLAIGNKAGASQKRFYKQLISTSDARCDAHLAKLRTDQERIMAKTRERLLAELSPERRKRVKARAAQLIAQEQSLRDLRQARRLTQQHMAKRLGVRQHSISRLEQRSDMLLSTLRDYVRKMGGELVITAQFPDRDPVRISGLAEIAKDPRVRARLRRLRTHAAPRAS